MPMKSASFTMISALRFEFTSALLLSQTQPVPLRQNPHMVVTQHESNFLTFYFWKDTH